MATVLHLDGGLGSDIAVNLSISIAPHEKNMALRWFRWVSELGGTAGHRVFLLPSPQLDMTEIVLAAEMAFPGAVEVLQDAEGIQSDWQSGELARSAAGPNSSFRQLAWHFYYANLGPWMFCELDCIPLKPDWLIRLETEYRQCGKPFMGAHVKIAQVPIHMSGNAIYPPNTPELAPTLVQRTNWITNGKEYELAFDVASATEVIPQAHWTTLIQHEFRHPGFKSRAEMDALIRPEAVVFHSNKSGDILPFLREKIFGHNLDAQASAPEQSGDGVLPVVPSLTPAHPSPSKDSRAALTRDTVAILRQLCDTQSRKALVQRELKRQKIVR